jgi:RNA polymerase sigma-70 factor, ECF subfamily
MSRQYSKFTDEELIGFVKDDKLRAESAFSEIYRRYSSTVHSYCVRMMNNRANAEDIFQETFIKFFQNIDDNFEPRNIPGFLITIARRLCLNQIRDNKPTIPLENMDFMLEEPNASERTELLELITMALDLLDFDYRESFVLREYNGLTYEEIANLCKISVTNAKSRVHRAKKKLRDILYPYLNYKTN